MKILVTRKIGVNMKDYVTFSDFPTPVNLAGLCGKFGVVNGYKLKSVLHGGRRIGLGKNTYFYVPSINRIVTYKASKARELIQNKDGKLNFRELFDDRKGSWHFYPDASTIYQIAFNTFKG
jgi:hypothetical protein